MKHASSDDLHLRSATTADAPELSAVAREAKALWGYAGDWLEAWRADLTIGVGDIERMIVRVAESNGVIAGFGAADRVDGVWEVAHLWVRPRFARQGIGRMLLGGLVRAVREAGGRRIRIESDPNAEAFYVRAGASRIGERPAPMPGAEHRVLPVLELSVE
jgi:ribosomal protein S18 acetylase RimI-like enzyme